MRMDLKFVINYKLQIPTLNSHFANVGDRIKDKIFSDRDFVLEEESNNYIFEQSERISDSLFLNPVTIDEISDLLGGLKKYNSYSEFGITNRILINMKDYIKIPIVHIFNLSFLHGKYPSGFKSAIVLPLFKSGDKKSLGNYRPISLTLSLSKILEKCIKVRLMSFIHKHAIISKRQYGFQPDISTSHALFDVSKHICQSLDRGDYVFGLFLDIEKAFDSISHKLLIKKIENYGIRGIALDLIKSYISNRTQIVKIDEIKSNLTTVNTGIPQGTVLGPLLFILYINNIFSIKTNGLPFCFADDTAFIFSGDCFNNLTKTVSDDFRLVKKYLNTNFLSINIQKTSLVSFSNGERKCSSKSTPHITLHSINCTVSQECSCQVLKFVNECKYLGIIFDSKMSFKTHILKLTSSIRKLFYKFKILRGILSYEVLRMVYFSLCQSLLLYGILVWGNTSEFILRGLSVAQNIVIKIILKKHPRFATLALYDEFRVLNLKQLFLLNACIHLYRINCTNYNLHYYPTRISSRTNIILPRIKTELYSRHAQIVGLRMAIKYRYNYDQFRNVRHIKSFLINSGFLRM